MNMRRRKKLLAAVRKLPAAAGVHMRVDELKYRLINLYLGRREFSLGNIFSLWKAVTYVGQISDAEAQATPFGRKMERQIGEAVAKVKDLSFCNNVVVFRRRIRRRQ